MYAVHQYNANEDMGAISRHRTLETAVRAARRRNVQHRKQYGAGSLVSFEARHGDGSTVNPDVAENAARAAGLI